MLAAHSKEGDKNMHSSNHLKHITNKHHKVNNVSKYKVNNL